MAEALLLSNACILDVVEGTISGERDVLVREGRIAEIGDRRLSAAGARRIDLKGRTLMPGLCDAHVHAVVPVDSSAALAKMSPYYLGARAAPILRAMLMRGFTTVRDAGGADFGLARAVDEGLIDGPRILYCGKGLSQTGGHGDMRTGGENVLDHHYNVPGLGRICDGIAEIRAAARDEIRRGASQIKILAGGGVVSQACPLDNDQFSEEELRAVVEEATMANIYVMAHAYTARQMTRAVKNGVRSIEHGNFLDDETAKLMAASNAILVPTLTIFEVTEREGAAAGFSDEIMARNKRVLDVGSRALEIAARHKVKMVYGTDVIGTLHPHQSLEFEIRANVLPAIEVIRAATCYAAELFRMQGEIGIVAPNARADLIAVNGNPMERIDILGGQGESLDLILKDGAVYKNAVS